MATKKKAKARKVFVLPDGTKYEVTGETGKFILCGDTQFRKSAGRGEIVEEKIPVPKDEAAE